MFKTKDEKYSVDLESKNTGYNQFRKLEENNNNYEADENDTSYYEDHDEYGYSESEEDFISEITDIQQAKELKDQEIEKVLQKHKKKGLFGKFRKQIDKDKLNDELKKSKNYNDFAILTDTYDEGGDFVILDDKKKNGVKIVKNVFGTAISIVLIVLASIALYFCLSYNFVPGNITGHRWMIGNISVVSKSYNPNLDELQPGDNLIVLENKNSFIPFQVSYKSYRYDSRNAYMLFAYDNENKLQKIEASTVDYVGKGTTDYHSDKAQKSASEVKMAQSDAKRSISEIKNKITSTINQ